MEMRAIVALFKALKEVGVVEDVKSAYALATNLRKAEELVRDRDRLIQAAVKRHDPEGKGVLTLEQKHALDEDVDRIDSEKFELRLKKVSLDVLASQQLSPSVVAALVPVIEDEDEEE